MTADPYLATAKGVMNPTDPQSWNHYAYAGSDPVNHNDPSGQDWCDEDTLFCFAIDFSTSEGGPFGNLSAYFPSAAQIAAQVAAAIQAAQNATPTTDCSIELETRPAKGTAGLGTHQYLYMTDRNDKTWVIEGGPTNFELGNFGDLRSYINANGGKGIKGDNPGEDAQVGLKLDLAWLQAFICDEVDQIVALAQSFKSSTQYYATGPNSNSFMKWLLLKSGLINFFPQPSGAVGWNTPIPDNP